MLNRFKKLFNSGRVQNNSKQLIEGPFNNSDMLRLHAIFIGRKNNSLLHAVKALQLLEKEYHEDKRHHKIIEVLKSVINNNREWDVFDHYFDDTNKDFRAFVQRQYPKITSNELRLMSLMKINLSNIEIGTTLNISQEGVKKARYRLRKKLGLKTSESLGKFIVTF